jgi:hypothetical protein
MVKNDAPRIAFRFLKEHLRSGKPFTYEELRQETGWSKPTFEKYLGTQWHEVLKKEIDGSFSVLREFQHITEQKFLSIFTQKRSLVPAYERIKYEQIMQYEFLLPLTYEGQLRKSLDELFYEDTLRERLRDIGQLELKNWIKSRKGEEAENYLKRVCQSVAEKFSGYSISHVSGRYLASNIKTRAEAAELLAKDEPYIIDETTAAVRFIIPLETTKQNIRSNFDKAECNEQLEIKDELVNEIAFNHWLFFNVFAEAIVHTVGGEDKIWLLEETPTMRRLYVWQKRGETHKDQVLGDSLFPAD